MAYKQEHLDYVLKDLESNPRELIAIVGPTCTGKTDLSIALAKELNLPVINADSRLIYQEMNIGTAKPTDDELKQVPHHLVNIRKPNETYSAGDYRRDFDAVISGFPEKRAIVVGGTGLYLRSALENLEMPAISRNDSLRQILETKNLGELVDQLDELDSQARNEVDIKNKIRVIRAIEILKASGKPLSESRSKASTNRYQVNYYGLNFHNRQALYDLIDLRVTKMMDAGLLQEVEALVANYGVTQTLLATIGYKEMISYINGETSLDSAIDLIRKRTRNYAKRQITWFKNLFEKLPEGTSQISPNCEISWLYH